MDNLKPLFIPLLRMYYKQFCDGTKDTEMRAYGPRWNEKTCTLGRDVTLSMGYGKTHRLQGRITGFTVDNSDRSRGIVYALTGRYGPMARIKIELVKA